LNSQVSTHTNLEARIDNLEHVVVKFFTFFKWTLAAVVLLSVPLLAILLLWFLGISAEQTVTYCKSVLSSPTLSVILTLAGLLGITVFGVVKPLQKVFHRIYFDKFVKPIIHSLKDDA
jgi:ABC-type sulfate transport system permease component